MWQLCDELGHSSAGDRCSVQTQLLQLLHAMQRGKAGVRHLCVAKRQLLQPTNTRNKNKKKIRSESERRAAGGSVTEQPGQRGELADSPVRDVGVVRQVQLGQHRQSAEEGQPAVCHSVASREGEMSQL